MGRSSNTISRELRRNKGIGSYQAETAQRLSDQRQQEARKYHKRIPEMIAWIGPSLGESRNQEQIASFAKAADYSLVSHDMDLSSYFA